MHLAGRVFETPALNEETYLSLTMFEIRKVLISHFLTNCLCIDEYLVIHRKVWRMALESCGELTNSIGNVDFAKQLAHDWNCGQK
jgi:hypothetical protein